MKLTNKSYPLARAVRSVLLASVTVSMLAMPTAFAAEADEESQVEEVTTEEVAEEVNKVIITGSRLQRETYTSLSPLQVITAEASREVGLIDGADILQGAAQSTGQQIDLTFSGFVLDNGPGSSTANLRGLGSARTLTLLNGRRMAPSGVEGAPAAADLNLIPGALVQQYDLLLDGASSIYGSDAVAGVVNVILRKDFDGFEADVFTTVPEQDNGVSNTVSLTWGKNYDRGFIGFGAQYTETERVQLKDREWAEDCNRNVEIDTNGNIRHVDLYYPKVLGQRIDGRGCKPTGGLVGRIIVPIRGSIYYTPGTSNGGWNGWSESSIPFTGGGIDSDGDGTADVSFTDYSLNGTSARQDADLFPKTEQLSIMAYGEYTLEGDANITPFFEVSFNKRDANIQSGLGQLFPGNIPGNNPWNPCNPNGINGVDCGLANDALYENPAVWGPVFDAFGCTIFAGGTCPQGRGAIGPQPVQIVTGVFGDRNITDIDMEQTRVVVGLNGDIPFMNFGDVTDWQFETYLSYTSSDGNSHRPGIRQDRITQSADVVETSPGSGEYVCVDQSNGCVPVNFFAPSLYPLGGNFATQAERDFLFDSRDFNTKYEQTIIAGFMGGSVAELPAGSITAGFGFEYRNDDIASIPDDIARDGLFFGFFSDGGAEGDKSTKEYFFEVEIPILANMTLAKELLVNLSARNTKDEFYGDNTTYSWKVGYRPIDSLLLRATGGTSYRAPNVRENFLRAQSGFGSVFDPCAIPADAIDDFTGDYLPSEDRRDQQVLINCLSHGVDPTTFFGNGSNVYSTEIATGGIEGLNEEESTSKTFGFSWAQPFSNSFDLTIGATYYKIEIDNTIVEPSAAFIMFDCYNDPQDASTFCSRITRDANNVLDIIDSSFLNRDNQTVAGVDVNVNFAIDSTILGSPVRWTADLVATHTKESSTLFTDDQGGINFDDDIGEFGNPDWRANLQLAATIGKYRFTWGTSYLGSVSEDEDSIQPFTDFSVSDTCDGLDGVLCRNFVEAPVHMVHSGSVYYRGDVWTIGAGVRNMFNKQPPAIDCDGSVSCRNNAPLGYGYDLNGRSFFVNVRTRF